jgi:hypothetical protein
LARYHDRRPEQFLGQPPMPTGAWVSLSRIYSKMTDAIARVAIEAVRAALRR